MTKFKPDVPENARPRSGLAQRIDGLRISESDRRVAEEALRNGELMADLIRRASENLKSAAALVNKSFTHRSK
jgi:hypothetical protein